MGAPGHLPNPERERTLKSVPVLLLSLSDRFHLANSQQKHIFYAIGLSSVVCNAGEGFRHEPHS